MVENERYKKTGTRVVRTALAVWLCAKSRWLGKVGKLFLGEDYMRVEEEKASRVSLAKGKSLNADKWLCARTDIFDASARIVRDENELFLFLCGLRRAYSRFLQHLACS